MDRADGPGHAGHDQYRLRSQRLYHDRPLTVLVDQDWVQLNLYSVLAINPQRCPKARYELATAFSRWPAGSAAQGLIRDFKLLGKPRFVPNEK